MKHALKAYFLLFACSRFRNFQTHLSSLLERFSFWTISRELFLPLKSHLVYRSWMKLTWQNPAFHFHLQWFRPMYFDRMLLLLFGMLTNVGLAVSGIVQHSTDFATHLLSIFITNLLLYKLFYIIMKLRHGERILFQPLLYIVLSTLSWAAALYFFANNSVTWGVCGTSIPKKWIKKTGVERIEKTLKK